MTAIKTMREKTGFSQEVVAARLNIDRSTVAKWETGVSAPRAELLPKLANLFGCSIDELFEQK